MIAGQSATEWARQGIVISAPTAQPCLTAEEAKQSALSRQPGATNLEVTLVHMEMPTSQVVPTSNYWAVAATPAPGTKMVGGPAGCHRSPRPATHVVVWLVAETGRRVLTRMWG